MMKFDGVVVFFLPQEAQLCLCDYMTYVHCDADPPQSPPPPLVRFSPT